MQTSSRANWTASLQILVCRKFSAGSCSLSLVSSRQPDQQQRKPHDDHTCWDCRLWRLVDCRCRQLTTTEMGMQQSIRFWGALWWGQLCTIDTSLQNYVMVSYQTKSKLFVNSNMTNTPSETLLTLSNFLAYDILWLLGSFSQYHVI